MRFLLLEAVAGDVLLTFDATEQALSLALEHADVVGDDAIAAIRRAHDSLFSARCLLDDEAAQ